MKAQIEQYNKKKRKTQQPNTKPLNKHITLLKHTAKHETKNPDNTHHLVLANSTTQMSSLAAA